MTMTFDVQEAKKAVVPAITHVDGTARVQTVGDESPLYHRLIQTFAERSSVPMVLNTSLNVKGQPVIADPRTALALFYSTGLSGMAIGPYYLRK
jgi:carbamoyltransferase